MDLCNARGGLNHGNRQEQMNRTVKQKNEDGNGRGGGKTKERSLGRMRERQVSEDWRSVVRHPTIVPERTTFPGRGVDPGRTILSRWCDQPKGFQYNEASELQRSLTHHLHSQAFDNPERTWIKEEMGNWAKLYFYPSRNWKVTNHELGPCKSWALFRKLLLRLEIASKSQIRYSCFLMRLPSAWNNSNQHQRIIFHHLGWRVNILLTTIAMSQSKLHGFSRIVESLETVYGTGRIHGGNSNGPVELPCHTQRPANPPIFPSNSFIKSTRNTKRRQGTNAQKEI